jgi:hypothetical protein
VTLVNTSDAPEIAAPASSSLAAVLLSVALVGITGSLSLQLLSPNVDVSWLLVTGERILGGAQLHRDIVEVNPPFSVWLYLPLLYGEAATGIRAETLMAFLLPALALGSAVLSGSILRAAGWFGSKTSIWWLPVVVLMLSWLFPGDFGQREQIATISLLPWLALLAARSTSSGFSAGAWPQIVIAGVGAAIFVMIKPPMAALSMILPAIWFAVSHRSLRPVFAAETIIAAAITLFYVAWIVTFQWTFLTEVMPSLAAYYIPLRLPLSELLAHWPLQAFVMLSVATWLLARPEKMDCASFILLLAGLGYIPGFLLMGKAWTYQAIPFLSFALLAFVIQLIRSGVGSPLRRIVTAAVAVQAMLMTYESLYLQIPPDPAGIAEISRTVGSRPTIVSIAAKHQPAHPLTRLVGGDFVGRFPSMWVAHNAELLAERTSDQAMRAEYLARRDSEIALAAAEIVRLSPDLVIAGGSEPAPAETAIMSAPSMTAALAPYRLLYRTAASTVFVRKDISSAR